MLQHAAGLHAQKPQQRHAVTVTSESGGKPEVAACMCARRADADGGAEHQQEPAGAGQRHLRAHAAERARALPVRRRMHACLIV